MIFIFLRENLVNTAAKVLADSRRLERRTVFQTIQEIHSMYKQFRKVHEYP
jgi:hypothetical protein